MALSMSDSQFATAVSYTVSKVGKTGIVLKVEQLSTYMKGEMCFYGSRQVLLCSPSLSFRSKVRV